MEQISEFLTIFSSWAIAITAIMAALSAVCKPVRNFIVWVGKRIFASGESKDAKIVEEIKRVESTLSSKMDKINDRHNDVEKVLSDKIETVSAKCDMYERNRLRTNIFRMGNFARKHQWISSEEFRNLQQDFEDYTALHGNGIAAKEYEFVVDYYNRSGWNEGDFDEQKK